MGRDQSAVNEVGDSWQHKHVNGVKSVSSENQTVLASLRIELVVSASQR